MLFKPWMLESEGVPDSDPLWREAWLRLHPEYAHYNHMDDEHLKQIREHLRLEDGEAKKG